MQFIERVYHFPAALAATASSLVFIGWAVSSPLMGYLSDKLGKRKPLMVFSAAFSTILFALIFYGSFLPTALLFVCLFLFGMANAGVSISFAVSGEINSYCVTGTSVAFANMASVLIGMICQPLIGWILVKNWSGKMLHGVPFYSAHDFRVAMSMLLGFLIIAFGASFFIKETYCRNVDDKILGNLHNADLVIPPK